MVSPNPAFLPELRARGLVHQMTSNELEGLLQTTSLTGYIGFDPTADSLHIGSFLPVTMLMRWQRAGHRPIAVVGGGTGLIGDPSGKVNERQLLTRDVLQANLEGLRKQLSNFLDFSGTTGAVIVDNYDWLGNLALIDFLRDVGKMFSVNTMIARDAVRDRLHQREQGLSYTEFSYILLQSYDFLALYDRLGCRVQLGGSDQWGNILSGTDLIRRSRGVEAFGLTQPLVLKADGTKFGKSEQGNIWLDPARTSPYQMYQFLLNTEDTDVVRLLGYLTFLELDEIAELGAATQTHPEQRRAQKALAREIVEMVHGRQSRERAERTTEVLFCGGDWRSLAAEDLEQAFAASPRSSLPRSALGTSDASLVCILTDAGLTPSRGQARQGLATGGFSLNDEVVKDALRSLGEVDFLGGRFAVLRRGKKSWHVVELV